jgi:hypothetical protein
LVPPTGNQSATFPEPVSRMLLRRRTAPNRSCRNDFAKAGGKKLGYERPSRSLRRRNAFRIVAIFAIFFGFNSLTLRSRAQSTGRSVSGGDETAQGNPIRGATSEKLVAKLATPYQAIVDGKPLRSLVNDIATAAEFDIWLDRQADPDQPVTLTAGRRTVFGAIREAARSVNLDAVAVGNVVLIGQKQRIAALAGVMISMPQELTAANASDGSAWPRIAWPEATTPTQALAIASGLPPGQLPELPHDLWPSVQWTGLSPAVATLLITAQFDQMSGDASAGNTVALGQVGPQRAQKPRDRESRGNPLGESLVKLEAPATVTQDYLAGPLTESIRSIGKAADPRAVFRVLTPRPGAARSTRALRMTARPEAHVAAIQAMLSHLSEPAAATAVDIDNVRFSLRLRFAPAGDVLAQLANAAGRTLQIGDSAAQTIRTPITLTGDDQTLRQLVETVAQQSRLRATWTDTILIIETAD